MYSEHAAAAAHEPVGKKCRAHAAQPAGHVYNIASYAARALGCKVFSNAQKVVKLDIGIPNAMIAKSATLLPRRDSQATIS